MLHNYGYFAGLGWVRIFVAMFCAQAGSADFKSGPRDTPGCFKWMVFAHVFLHTLGVVLDHWVDLL